MSLDRQNLTPFNFSTFVEGELEPLKLLFLPSIDFLFLMVMGFQTMPLMPLDQVYGKHTYCLTLHA